MTRKTAGARAKQGRAVEGGRGAAPYERYTQILSHELRTPMTAILGYLELLERDGLLDDQVRLRRYLGVVRGRAQDLARIVSELTTFADLASDTPLAETTQPTSLEMLLVELNRNHRLQVEANADALAATVDPPRLRLILEQLLDNAARHGAPETPILVRATLEGELARLVLYVSNEGPPIPAALREAIFAPFQQAEEPSIRRVGGLGLGLTIARRAAEGMGGSLALEPGLLTTFRVELPRYDTPTARQARALREQAARADAQTLRAIQDFRAMRSVMERERQARELAEAQQLRTIADFRAAHQRALALADRLDRTYLETITSLAKAVEARDSYTGNHVERVRRYTLETAAVLRLDGEAVRQIEFAAVLHDVGKIGVPDAILRKPGPLDEDEWTIMRAHPEIGRRVLEGISFLAPALEGVASHHEHWNGQGYPDGLAGEAIPLAGRIVSIADAYDAMVTDRIYRKGLTKQAALAEIERGRGTQFDPDIGLAFLTGVPHIE